MKVSEKIYRLRTENDLTQLEFGKIAGVSDKAVSTWELGAKEPRMKPLQKICAHFDIDINLFVDEDNDVYRKELPTLVPKSGQAVNIVRIAGRDGSYMEKQLGDKELQALMSFIELLPDASDDL